LDLPPVESRTLGLMPAVKHKANQDYLGMFAFEMEDHPKIVRALIVDLKPATAKRMLPGLPAYIIFMMIRHTDHVNDENKFRTLMNGVINAIKKLIKKKSEEPEYGALWLTNIARLLHNLKQYSGDRKFQDKNTTKQNSQALCHFDLVDYRQVLCDLALWIHTVMVKAMTDQIGNLITPALMEHDAIPGLSSGPSNTGVSRSRANSSAVSTPSGDSAGDGVATDPQNAMESLKKKLDQFLKMVTDFGMDPELIVGVFKQIYYFMGATSLNCLLLRKNLCHWAKGMQIRYNLSHIEDWARENKLDVLEPLQPIIEASQLLQARKTEEDVEAVCNMCVQLRPQQIVKILNLYTPANDYEERLSPAFLKKVSELLAPRLQKEIEGNPGQQPALLLNTKTPAYAVKFPFNPSGIKLEDIEIPDVLNLNCVKKL
jgi:myosin-5